MYNFGLGSLARPPSRANERPAQILLAKVGSCAHLCWLRDLALAQLSTSTFATLPSQNRITSAHLVAACDSLRRCYTASGHSYAGCCPAVCAASPQRRQKTRDIATSPFMCPVHQSQRGTLCHGQRSWQRARASRSQSARYASTKGSARPMVQITERSQPLPSPAR